MAAPPLTYRVYLNLFEMLKCRGLTVTTAIMPLDKWAQLQFDGYTTISATNEAAETLVVLIDDIGTHVANAASFDKFMKIISHQKFEYNTMLLVTRDDLGSNITNKFATYRAPISNYAYRYFTSNRMLHDSVPKVRILGKEEIKKIMTMNHIMLSTLPRLKLFDPVAVWYGLESGQVIEEVMVSEISGREIKYRLVWQ